MGVMSAQSVLMAQHKKRFQGASPLTAQPMSAVALAAPAAFYATHCSRTDPDPFCNHDFLSGTVTKTSVPHVRLKWSFAVYQVPVLQGFDPMAAVVGSVLRGFRTCD